MTRNRIHRFFKRAAGAAQAVGDDALDDLPAVEQDGEWSAAFNSHVLQAAMKRARPHFEAATWEAFRLAWLEQQPAPATAATLGIAVAAVYLAKSRVLKRLRDEVALIADNWPLDPA